MARTERQLLSPEVLNALVVPVRHDILDRLVALGPVSVRELARALGRAPTAIYGHLQMLKNFNLVEVVDQPDREPSFGRPATVYAATASLFRFTEAAKDPANRAVIQKISTASARQAARDFAKAVEMPDRVSEGPERNFTAIRLVSAPSPKRLAKINALLDQVAELVWAPDKNPGPVISIAWFISPLDDHGKKN
jgi:DNA-binding transcriptional ArsR family regulator